LYIGDVADLGRMIASGLRVVWQLESFQGVRQRLFVDMFQCPSIFGTICLCFQCDRSWGCGRTAWGAWNTLILIASKMHLVKNVWDALCNACH